VPDIQATSSRQIYAIQHETLAGPRKGPAGNQPRSTERPAARDSKFQFLSDARNDLETDPVIDGGRGIGRRLCVFRDGVRERVARLFKRIFACDGLRVAVKELALGVDV